MWERGAGRTQACGSGGCAVAFVAATKLMTPEARHDKVMITGTFQAWNPIYIRH